MRVGTRRDTPLHFTRPLSDKLGLVQSKAKFPGRQLVYVSRNWGFTPFPKDVFTDGRQMSQSGPIDWKGAKGIIKMDGVGSRFASKRSIRLSKLGIWHASSGDSKERPSDAMRLNWTL